MRPYLLFNELTDRDLLIRSQHIRIRGLHSFQDSAQSYGAVHYDRIFHHNGGVRVQGHQRKQIGLALAHHQLLGLEILDSSIQVHLRLEKVRIICHPYALLFFHNVQSLTGDLDGLLQGAGIALLPYDVIVFQHDIVDKYQRPGAQLLFTLHLRGRQSLFGRHHPLAVVQEQIGIEASR